MKNSAMNQKTMNNRLTLRRLLGRIFVFVIFFGILFSSISAERNSVRNAFAQEQTAPPLDLSALQQTNAGKEQLPTSSVSTSSAPKDESEAKSNVPVPGTGTGPAVSNSNSSASPETAETGSVVEGKRSGKTEFWRLVKAGGFIGVILLILSFIACTIVIQFCFILRRKEIVPPDLMAEVQTLLEQGRYRSAQQLCGNDNSLFARILFRGLDGNQGSWSRTEKSLEDALSEETAAFYRKSETLSVIGNIAPMLGLLGTVIGMVLAFGELAASDGLGKNLAQGIYFALVTTVDGLIVAIPSLLAYSIINNQIAARISELAELVNAVTKSLKKEHPTVFTPTVPTGTPGPIGPAGSQSPSPAGRSTLPPLPGRK